MTNPSPFRPPPPAPPPPPPRAPYLPPKNSHGFPEVAKVLLGIATEPGIYAMGFRDGWPEHPPVKAPGVRIVLANGKSLGVTIPAGRPDCIHVRGPGGERLAVFPEAANLVAISPAKP